MTIIPQLSPRGREAAMSEIMPFEFRGLDVRVLLIDQEPWWVLADVCDVLEIQNARRVAGDQLDADEVRTTYVTDSLGRRQQAYAVNESGLYSLVMRSRKPQAKVFRRWVTHEVLPQIRRTGRYEAAPLTELEVAERYVAALKTNQLLSAEVAELSPKAEAFDELMSADGTFSIEAAAKIIFGSGLGRNRLFERLYREEILIRGSRLPYQRYMRYFKVSAHTYARRNGGTGLSHTPALTPEGLEWLRKRFVGNGQLDLGGAA